jgi:bifunctional DNA-binding transcriptional regulator/antitoxin component of YhaV-PrlF toxin-antitoxin module
MTTLTISKRGSVTIPPAIRRRLGLDAMSNPLLIVEERDGGIFMQPAAATPVRDLPVESIREWIREDEAAMARLRSRRGKKAR